MQKKIKVEFYRIEVPSTIKENFEQILQHVYNIPVHDRTQTGQGAPISLHQAYNNSDFWEGEIVRIRMIDPPSKASLSGSLEDIPLNDDEGIGERTAFLYHIPTRVVILERTQSGVSVMGFAKYFQCMYKIDEPIAVDPVLNGDAMTKLRRMKEIQKFEVRVAGIDNPGILYADSDIGVKEMANIAEMYCAPSVSLVVSMAQKKNDSLLVERVVQTAMRLVSISESSRNSNNKQKPSKIRITGSTDEDQNGFLVDLIKDRMRLEVSINYKGRGIPYPERQKALQTAWKQHESEICKLYLPA